MKWWRKDIDGYPIEFIKGKSIYNFIRCIVQNLRKFILHLTFWYYRIQFWRPQKNMNKFQKYLLGLE